MVAGEKRRVLGRVDHHAERACRVPGGVHDADVGGHLSYPAKERQYVRGDRTKKDR